MELVIIRADGNKHIGMGHLTRQIIIAQKFQEYNFEIIFITQEFIEAISILREYNFKYQGLEKNQDTMINTKIALENIIKVYNRKPDIIVVDLLKDFDNQGYINILKSYCKKVVLFTDDSEKLCLNADIVFALSQEQENLDYSSVKGTKYYTGLNYFPLGEEYKNIDRKIIKKDVSKILITFGGSDPQFYSERVLECVIKLKLKVEITLIVGPAVSDKRYEKIKKNPNDFIIIRNEKNIIKHYKETDMCICSAGNTLIELLTFGVPCIVLPQTERERIHSNRFKTKKMIVSLNNDFINTELITKIRELMNNFLKRKLMSRNSQKNLNGQGLQNIFRIILNQD